MQTANLIVIGAGPGGYNAAAAAARRGQKVVLIERDNPGGTCLNRGCIPTKCFCRSAQIALDMGEAAAMGVEGCGNPRIDLQKVIARKDEVVAQLREGVGMLLKDVTLVRGCARFVAENAVEAEGEVYSAPRIIVATGSRPAILPVEGAKNALTSDGLLSFPGEVPESLVIIGGGVIGIEFASVFSAFGSRVTVLEYCREILPPFDPEIAKRLRMSLRKRGIDVQTSAEVTAVSADGEVSYRVKGKDSQVKADLVLMATGRVPVIPEGLDRFVRLGKRGEILVDRATMKAEGSECIYAIGDVNGLCMLAHAAEAQAEVAVGNRKENPQVIPSAVFSVPECAMVGLTEPQCLERGLEVCIGKSFMRTNGKALSMGEPDGLVKIIADKSTGRILGCHIVGAHAADIIQEAATAMSAGLTISAIAEAVHAHPTLSETVRDAAKNAI